MCHGQRNVLGVRQRQNNNYLSDDSVLNKSNFSSPVTIQSFFVQYAENKVSFFKRAKNDFCSDDCHKPAINHQRFPDFAKEGQKGFNQEESKYEYSIAFEEEKEQKVTKQLEYCVLNYYKLPVSALRE